MRVSKRELGDTIMTKFSISIFEAEFRWRMPSKPKFRARNCLILFLLVYILSSTNSFADCPVVNPRDQPVFWAFEQYVADNYRPREGVARDRLREFELAYGHALGRLALAVGDDPARKEEFECVAKGIDQLAHLQFGLDGPSAWIGVSEAARGMDDYAVNTRFGVADISPLDIVFAIAEQIAGREPSTPGSGGYTDRPGNESPEPGLTILGENEPAAPAASDLPKVSSTILGGHATPDYVCESDTPAQGQSIGTAFGTLGPWMYKYAKKDSDDYNKGGSVLNLCGRGVIEAYLGGTTYIGHYDGTEFSGVWFGNPACSMASSGYRYDNAPYGNTCWGEIAWRILDYVPEKYSNKKLGQVAFGYWNYCGKQGSQGKGGNWWYGDYYLYAVQQVTKP